MLIDNILNKDPAIVPESAHLIILNRKCTFFIVKNGEDTKHTRNISRRLHFMRNSKNAKCTGLDGVKEVCNWQALVLRM